jgi:hypothetical protein
MNARTLGLLAFTSLLVTFVRNLLQYHRYSFESIGEFFFTWLAHYIAIGLVGALFYAFLGPVQKLVLGAPQDGRQPSMASAVVSWCLAVILLALLTLVLANWPVGYSEGLSE